MGFKFTLFTAVLATLVFSSVGFSGAEELEIHSQALSIEIAEKNLAEALIDFSRIYNLVVVAIPSEIENFRSHAVVGEYSAQQALLILLQGTPLKIQKRRGEGFVIVNPLVRISSELEDKDAVRNENNNTDNNETQFIEDVLILGSDLALRPANGAGVQTVIDTASIEAYQLDSASLLTRMATNITYPAESEGVLFMNIRGLGNEYAGYNASEPIITHYNGQHKRPTEINKLVLFDMANISVLPGPQVAESGRSSLGGSLYFRSASAELENNFTKISLEMGDYNKRQIDFVVNQTLSDYFALRFSGTKTRRDGYVEIWQDYGVLEDDPNNPIQGYPIFSELSDWTYYSSPSTKIDKYENADKEAWRLSTKLKIRNFDWEFRVEEHIDQGTGAIYLDPYVAENYKRAVVIDSPGQVHSSNKMFSSDLNLFFPNLVFSYKNGWSGFSNMHIYDYDQGRLGHFSEARTLKMTEKSLRHNIELYTHDNASLNWLIGFYADDHIHSSEIAHDNYNFNPDNWWASGSAFLLPEVKNYQRDLYARLKYKISQDFSLITDARLINSRQAISDGLNFGCIFPTVWYESLNDLRSNLFYSENLLAGETTGGDSEGRGFDQPCYAWTIISGESQWKKPVYSLALNYEASTNYALFSKYSTGFSAGKITPGGQSEPQTIQSAELGIRKRRNQGKLDYEFSLFHNRVININELSGWINDETYNEVKADIEGADASLTYSYSASGKIKLNISLLNARLTNYYTKDAYSDNQVQWNTLVPEPDLAAEGYLDLASNYLKNAPKYSANLNLDHTFYTSFGKITPHLLINYKSPYYLDIFNRDNFYLPIPEENWSIEAKNVSLQEHSQTIDIALNWSSTTGRFSSNLYIFNVSNELVRTQTNENFLGANGFASLYAPPRTFGLNFSAYF